MYKYSKIYSGDNPVFIEDDIFTTIIPLVSKTTVQATNQATDQADDNIKRLLEFCKTPRTRENMQEFMKLNNRGYFRTNILNL